VTPSATLARARRDFAQHARAERGRRLEPADRAGERGGLAARSLLRRRARARSLRFALRPQRSMNSMISVVVRPS